VPKTIAQQEACGHRGAQPTDRVCAECGGILRRCCQSTVLTSHVAGCPEVAKR